MSFTQTRAIVPFGTDNPDISAVQPVFEASDWCIITLKKQTSGNVEFSTSANVFPLGAANNITLPTDVPITFLVAPGTKIYAAQSAGSVEKLGMIVVSLTPVIALLKTLIGGK